MIETKEQFEELITNIEVAVNEVWDDVQYLRGGDPRETIKDLTSILTTEPYQFIKTDWLTILGFTKCKFLKTGNRNCKIS